MLRSSGRASGGDIEGASASLVVVCFWGRLVSKAFVEALGTVPFDMVTVPADVASFAWGLSYEAQAAAHITHA